jgi:DNA helicase II / ATP-dependent DNA helicase PcrA
MPLDHLAKLHIEQRRAVEHGVGGDAAGLSAPLLVIAGAGSGKTNTLAHRVVNLIVNGVDPRRILLMTFSCRAASEMRRRVESICSKVLGAKATLLHGSAAVVGEGLIGPGWNPVHNRKLRRAVQTPRETSSSYPEIQVSGHELAGI